MALAMCDQALMQINLDDYITAEEAAQALGYHTNSVRRLARDGELQGIKFGNYWLITRQSVEALKDKLAGRSKFGPRSN